MWNAGIRYKNRGNPVRIGVDGGAFSAINRDGGGILSTGNGVCKRIAILLDWPFASTYHNELSVGIAAEAFSRGIEVIEFGLGDINRDGRDEILNRFYADILAKPFIDGILLLTGSILTSGGLKGLRSYLDLNDSLPMVGIGQAALDEAIVTHDQDQAFSGLMNHLLSVHGYTKFAFVGGPAGNSDAKARREVFLSSLREANIEFDSRLEWEGAFVYRDGYDAARHFFKELGLRPEVVVCANDTMAMGVYRSLFDMGIRVPQDCAITGYDNFALSPYLDLDFTTVPQPVREQGARAVRYLAETMDRGRSRVSEPMVVEGQGIVLGRSCGCPPESEHTDSRLKESIALDLISRLDAVESGDLFRNRLDSFASRFMNSDADNLDFTGLGSVLESAGIRSAWIYLFQDIRSPGCWVYPCYARIDGIEQVPSIQPKLLDIRVAFPHSQKSHAHYVMGLLGDGELRFGVFICSTENKVEHGYEALRSRLSLILRLLHMKKELRQANDKLSEEIHVRQEAELMLAEALRKTEALSITDELTGLHNRRGFISLAEQQLCFLRRHPRPFAVLFLDLDNLKNINDKYGHASGDAAIKAVADALTSELRGSDLTGRWGGDEFTALVYSPPRPIEGILQRIRERIATPRSPLLAGIGLGCSIGLCMREKPGDETLNDLIAIADEALYIEKKARKKDANG